MDIAALADMIGEAAPMPFTTAPPPDPRLVAHMDGDYAAYYCAGNDDCSAGEARRNVIQRVERLKFVTGATKVYMHLTDGASHKGHRFLVAQRQPYQGQRNAGRKPHNWHHLREWMESYTGDLFIPRLWADREADDGMAYACDAVAATGKHGLHVCHTADKDMRMFAGKHVIWKTFQVHEVPYGTYESVGPDGEVYGHKWFWMQCLMGDTADHIPGINRLGKAGAVGLLAGTSSNSEAAPLVFGRYREAFGDAWADAFVEQAALLWMRVDRHASIGNFLSLGVFGPAVSEAVGRLQRRVEEAVTEFEMLKC